MVRALGASLLLVLTLGVAAAPSVAAQAVAPSDAVQAERGPAREAAGGEANLVLPDLSTVEFRGVNGRTLLLSGLVICVLGLLFGLLTFTNLEKLPVHPAMREVSELIYETCKTYLVTQGRFILI